MAGLIFFFDFRAESAYGAAAEIEEVAERFDLETVWRIADLGAPSMATLDDGLAARAFAWLDQKDPQLSKRFAHALLHAVWAEGHDMSSGKALAALGAGLMVRIDDLTEGLQLGDEASGRRTHQQEAKAAGVKTIPSVLHQGVLLSGPDIGAQIAARIG
jgi:2-hydroxychromene-2-carboxylate isomerase